MADPRTIQLGQTTVYIDPAQPYVRTTFSDGTYVEARPNHTPEDLARAESLGYDGVDRMTLDHDAVHCFLADRAGLPVSPVLWAVAHESHIDQADVDAEEGEALLFQRWINDPGTAVPFPFGWRCDFLRLVR